MQGGLSIDDVCADHSAHARALKQHDKRLDSHSGEIDDIKACVVRITALLERQQDEANKQAEAYEKWRDESEARIAALEAKPGQRWEQVQGYLLTCVLGLVVGIVGAYLGLK